MKMDVGNSSYNLTGHFRNMKIQLDSNAQKTKTKPRKVMLIILQFFPLAFAVKLNFDISNVAYFQAVEMIFV